MRMQFPYANSNDYFVCEHCGCHEEGNLVVIHALETGNHLVCESCARENYIRSDYDFEWHDLEHIRSVSNPQHFKSTPFYTGPHYLYRLGKFITAQEYSDFCQRFCECCNSVINRFDRQIVWVDGEQEYFCDDCVREYIEDNDDYTLCHDCREWVPSDETYWADCHQDYICDSCYDRDYFTCDSCEEVHRWDDAVRVPGGDYYCPDCYEREYGSDDDDDDDDDDEEDNDGYDGEREVGEHMRDYGWDPDPFIFYKTHAEAVLARKRRQHGQSAGLFFMGSERENSHSDYDDRDEHSEIIHDGMNPLGSESWFYQKHDGSLHKGIECVSMPMTFDYMLENVRPVLEEHLPCALQYVSEGESDGLHIHASRKGMNMGHRVRFGAFFELCRYQMELCARRSGNGYAQFFSNWDYAKIGSSKDMLDMLNQYSTQRRRCVNWLNDKTVEVRMFRTPSCVEDLIAAYALVHAAYQFTKRIGWRKMFYAGRCGVLWDWFLDFAAQDKRYLDLFNQLDRLTSNMGSVKDDTGDDLDYYFMPRDHDMYEIPCSIIINRAQDKLLRKED